MKNVLYIISTLQISGPTNIVYNIIKELDRNKFNPIILCLSNEGKDKNSAYNEFRALNIKVYSLELSRIVGFVIGRIKISQFCREKEINTIHIVGLRADLLVQGIRFKNYILVSSVFSNLIEDYSMHYGAIIGRIIAHMHLKSLKNKLKVACSNYVNEELRKWVDSDFKVIKNAVSHEKFMVPSNELKVQIRKKLNIGIHKKVFIFVGVLIKRKDPLTTIKAFLNSNVNKNGDAVLIILGDGPLRNNCEELCSNVDSVKFMGNTSETLSYLHASDYYISSSYSEGLPTSVVEALSCGLVPILSDIKPHREMTNYLKNRVYSFNVGDIKTLSKMIDDVIHDDYSFLSIQCRNHVEAELNSKIMSDQYQSLY